MRLAFAVALALIAAPALAAGKTRIAVTEIRSVQGVSAGTATILSDIVVSEVSENGFDVVSQSDINAMIGFERQKQVLGCAEDSSCLAEIGGALGVDYMLTGQVGQIGSRYRISLLVVDTKKAKVVARSAQFCDVNEDALARAAESTVGQLLGAVRGGTIPLPPAPVASAAPKTTAPTAEAAKPARNAAPSLAVTPKEPPRLDLGAATGTGRTGVSRPMRTAAWVTLGAGGALLVAGLVSGVAAQSRYDELESLRGELGYFDAYGTRRDGITKAAKAADFLMITGGLAAGAGGYLWWRSGRVAFTPVASSGTLGVAAAGKF
jgi:TolB-like protein